MSGQHHIAFLGTSRSGLGHLRRMANIAAQLKQSDPGLTLTLLSYAEPAGLGHNDIASFSQIRVCETEDMMRCVSHAGLSMVVCDTMNPPGGGQFRGQMALILRETPQDRLERFRRDDGRAWDCVIVPNAADHWMPRLEPGFAQRIEAAGWIVRPTGPRAPGDMTAGVVLATGGGGTPDTRAGLYPMLSDLIQKTRSHARTRFRIRQALGPRAAGQALPGVDEVCDPGPDLNHVFRAADVVISTAGYNSVLELASTDTPALLVSIPRSLDDQAARVRRWGPQLGFGLSSDQVDEAALWLADQIDMPRRRAPVDLGPDGAIRAAEVLLDMLCPAS